MILGKISGRITATICHTIQGSITPKSKLNINSAIWLALNKVILDKLQMTGINYSQYLSLA